MSECFELHTFIFHWFLKRWKEHTIMFQKDFKNCKRMSQNKRKERGTICLYNKQIFLLLEFGWNKIRRDKRMLGDN